MKTISRHLLGTIIVVLIITTGIFAAGRLGGGQFDFSYSPAPLFGPFSFLDSPILFQNDGKILSFGSFAPNLNGKKLFRYLPDGQPESSFNPYYPTTNVDIEHAILQPDGKILYTYLYNDSENYSVVDVVRLNADGSQDTSFNFTFRTEGPVFDIALDGNGKIILGGRFLERSIINAPRRFMLRLNPNGSLDNSFDSIGTDSSQGIEVQPDSRVLYIFAGMIRRINTDGSIDTSFSSSLTDVREIRLLPDGKFLVRSGGQNLFRINLDGSNDATFNSAHTLSRVDGFTVLNDGKLLLFEAGAFNQPPTRFELLNTDGTYIRAFSNPFIRTTSIHINPNGSLFVRGSAQLNGRTIGIARMRLDYVPSNQKATDFDGDGKSDIAVFRPSSGVWYIYLSATGTYSVTQFGLNGDKPVPADYDGDRIADIAVYRPSTGVWYRLNSSNGAFHAVRFGLAADIPTPNDYDADGRDDISVFRPSDGNWYRLNSTDNSFSSFHFGATGDKPVPGDYDGDAKADFGVWRPSESVWYRTSSLNNSFGSSMISYFDEDVAAPMDVDGDGRIDISYWKGFSRAWRGVYSSNSSGFFFPWGLSGDIPVPGDYDGDGRDDIAIWRPSTGVWWIGNSSTGAVSAIQFGTADDIPVQSSRTH